MVEVVVMVVVEVGVMVGVAVEATFSGYISQTKVMVLKYWRQRLGNLRSSADMSGMMMFSPSRHTSAAVTTWRKEGVEEEEGLEVKEWLEVKEGLEVEEVHLFRGVSRVGGREVDEVLGEEVGEELHEEGEVPVLLLLRLLVHHLPPHLGGGRRCGVRGSGVRGEG